MSRSYRFRVVNVFAISSHVAGGRDGVQGAAVSSRLSGNPLAVIENAENLSHEEMQQLALQFNLSESTFILPADSADADARVRIFTPTFEMPFAGHPTLGTAHVLRTLRGGGDGVRLHLNAGMIPVVAKGDVWTLTANVPTHRAYDYTNAQLAQALGLREDDIAGTPLWMNAGVEQLILPAALLPSVFRAIAAVARALSRSRLIRALFHGQFGNLFPQISPGKKEFAALPRRKPGWHA